MSVVVEGWNVMPAKLARVRMASLLAGNEPPVRFGFGPGFKK